MKKLIKSPEEIELLSEGGKILAVILNEVAGRAKAGVSTWDLNEYAEGRLMDFGARSSFKNYAGPKFPFPATLCTSINDEVVHGIPSKNKILKEGDIIGLDFGVFYKNLYTDGAVTVGIGKISPEAKKIINAAEAALAAGINAACAGNRTGAISEAIQKTAKAGGFDVVRELVGHGVGYAVHEEPAVPCFGSSAEGPRLAEGMVLAIEPMLTAGFWKLRFEDDGWTARTADGRLSAHAEHTIAITRNGPVVLTAK